jgi:hypothetical protein
MRSSNAGVGGWNYAVERWEHERHARQYKARASEGVVRVAPTVGLDGGALNCSTDYLCRIGRSSASNPQAAGVGPNLNH